MQKTHEEIVKYIVEVLERHDFDICKEVWLYMRKKSRGTRMSRADIVALKEGIPVCIVEPKYGADIEPKTIIGTICTTNLADYAEIDGEKKKLEKIFLFVTADEEAYKKGSKKPEQFERIKDGLKETLVKKSVLDYAICLYKNLEKNPLFKEMLRRAT